jgi:hypothetical protein
MDEKRSKEAQKHQIIKTTKEQRYKEQRVKITMIPKEQDGATRKSIKHEAVRWQERS